MSTVVPNMGTLTRTKAIGRYTSVALEFTVWQWISIRNMGHITSSHVSGFPSANPIRQAIRITGRSIGQTIIIKYGGRNPDCSLGESSGGLISRRACSASICLSNLRYPAKGVFLYIYTRVPMHLQSSTHVLAMNPTKLPRFSTTTVVISAVFSIISGGAASIGLYLYRIECTYGRVFFSAGSTMAKSQHQLFESCHQIYPNMFFVDVCM